MDLPSRLDLFALGRDYVLQRAQRIDPAQVDVEGSDVNIFVGSQSVVADYIVKQLAYAVARLTLDGADEDDLDRYVYDRYQQTRKGASAARGRVRLYRTAAGAAGTVPVGTKLLTATGIEYITTTSATFGGGTLQVFVPARAVQAGKETQVGANAIRRFARPGELFDPLLQVNNDLGMAGGEPAEEDEVFRDRIRKFWKSARRGVLAAIEFGALTVPGVTSVQAIEVLAGDANYPARVVMLYIADSSGIASAELGNDVIEALNDWRAGGIAVIVSTSLPQIVDVQLRLAFRAGVDTVSLTEDIRAAVVEFVNSLPVNGTLYVLQLGSVFQRFAADGLIVNRNTLAAPLGDLVPAAGQTLRTTMNNVTRAL